MLTQNFVAVWYRRRWWSRDNACTPAAYERKAGTVRVVLARRWAQHVFVDRTRRCTSAADGRVRQALV